MTPTIRCINSVCAVYRNTYFIYLYVDIVGESNFGGKNELVFSSRCICVTDITFFLVINVTISRFSTVWLQFIEMHYILIYTLTLLEDDLFVLTFPFDLSFKRTGMYLYILFHTLSVKLGLVECHVTSFCHVNIGSIKGFGASWTNLFSYGSILPVISV